MFRVKVPIVFMNWQNPGRLRGFRQAAVYSAERCASVGKQRKSGHMKLIADESGQTVSLVAVFMGLVAIGFIALALDVGTLCRERRVAQSAADAAALAAAEELTLGYTSNEQAAANAMAGVNGFSTTQSTNPATVTLQPPIVGTFTGSSYVQATVTKSIPTYFMAAFNRNLATMSVTATAI